MLIVFIMASTSLALLNRECMVGLLMMTRVGGKM